MRRRDHGDEGFSLIELVVVMLVMSIAFAMTGVIVSNLTGSATTEASLSASNATGHVALNGLDNFLSGIVSPCGSTEAGGGYSTTTNPTTPCTDTAASAPTTTSPCWGTSLSTVSGNTLASLVPAHLGVESADDYQLEFCGYPPGTGSSANTPPNIYKAGFNLSGTVPCSGASCTLQLINCGTDPTCTASPAGCVIGTSCTTPSLAWSQAHVWCDAAVCQQNGTTSTHCATTITGTPPVFCVYSSTGSSGTALNPLNVTSSSATNLLKARFVSVTMTVLSNPNSVILNALGVPAGSTLHEVIYLSNLAASGS